MGLPADWLEWHEERWNLPPAQGGRQEYAPNGPPRGIVPFPLTDAEFDLLLKRFFLADDMLTTALVDGKEVLDTEVAQTLRGKLMEWVEAYGQFPVLADTEAASNAYNTPMNPDSYYEWRTVASIKSTMPYVPAAQLQDSSGNDLPDDFPVLMLAPRKYGGFGGVLFYHDDWPDTTNWAIYFTKATDFIADHPEYTTWLISNGGYVSDTDLVCQIHLSRQHFLNSTAVINFILTTIINNIGILNLSFPNVIINYPTTPPGGTWPPGTSGPPDATYVPPPPLNEPEFTYDCGLYPVYSHQGTNDLELAGNLGFAAIAAAPIPVLKEVAYSLKSAINAKLSTDLGFTLSQVDLVELCVQFAYLSRVEVTGFKITESAISSKPPTLTVITLAENNTPSTTYSEVLKPSEEWATAEFAFSPPMLNTTLSAKGIVAVAINPNSVLLDHYSDIADIQLSCELMPAIFDSANNPFANTTDSPFLELSIIRVRTKLSTWRGVGFAGDIDNVCGVVGIAPGFLQDAWSVDLKNATGDTQDLFSGVNWISTIDAILVEVYCPNTGSGMWMPPSGSSGQSTMDAWRAANPQAYYDGSNNLIIYSDTLATNQICYTWLKVSAGMTTNFAVDIYPVPLTCWARIVAFHDSGTGEIKVQDDANKCTTITYPPYPAYPF